MKNIDNFYAEPKEALSPYQLAWQTMAEIGGVDVKSLGGHDEEVLKAQELIGNDEISFFDKTVRSWCTQIQSQELINSIVSKLKQLRELNAEQVSQVNIFLNITKDVSLLWKTEKKLQEEAKKRGVGQIFLLGGIIVCLSAFAIGKKGVENAKQVQFPFYELQVEELPDSLQGVSIVHLSDLHASDNLPLNPINSQNLLQIKKGLLMKLNEQKIDLSKLIIVISGDHFSEGASRAEIVKISKILGSFPGNKVFVLGNHDVRHHETDFIVSELQKNGIFYLDHSGIDLHGIKIVGLPDATTQPKLYPEIDLAKLKDLPKEPLRVLMTHDLSAIDSLLPVIPKTLVLSGHTHGGQINVLPERWQKWLLEMIGFQYSAQIFSGMEQITKNTVAGVSPGIGTGLIPMRFKSPPEISIIVLSPLSDSPSDPDNVSDSIKRNIFKSIFSMRK